MKWIHLPIALAVAIIGAAGCRPVPVRPPSTLPHHDDISFRGFAEEALHGYGTPRTHRFDDYTPGSYHVDAREVAEGFFKIAPTYGLPPGALAVVGPMAHSGPTTPSTEPLKDERSCVVVAQGGKLRWSRFGARSGSSEHQGPSSGFLVLPIG